MGWGRVQNNVFFKNNAYLLSCGISHFKLTYTILITPGCVFVHLFITQKENRVNVLFLSFGKWISEFNIFLWIFINLPSVLRRNCNSHFASEETEAHGEHKGLLAPRGELASPDPTAWDDLPAPFRQACDRGSLWKPQLVLHCGVFFLSLKAISFSTLTKSRLLGKRNRIY